jgi:hypothetical protein
MAIASIDLGGDHGWRVAGGAGRQAPLMFVSAGEGALGRAPRKQHLAN